MQKTEYEIEKEFIEIMQRSWYKYVPTINNYDKLLDNFRDILNRVNQENLQGQPISDDEFKEIKIYLECKNVFEASQILRTGKIDVIKRKTRTLYLKIIDLQEIEKNTFQIIHQVVNQNSDNIGRFDVTLLINGVAISSNRVKKTRS